MEKISEAYLQLANGVKNPETKRYYVEKADSILKSEDELYFKKFQSLIAFEAMLAGMKAQFEFEKKELHALFMGNFHDLYNLIKEEI